MHTEAQVIKMESLPTPPNEEQPKPAAMSRKGSGSSKTVKTVHRASKRASDPHAHAHPASPVSDSHASHSVDGRHKRVWKACERCRMKKTKCDGEFPCKRCKDDGLVCTAGTRKKTEYKQLPRGYAEVLENTQFALIATVHKLYSMVRNGQTWDLGEPELNDRGQPIIHNIASKLGCIRPNSDIDLPVHSVFPEDEAGLTELARQLEEQQKDRETQPCVKHETDSQCNAMDCNRTDRASSSELDHSDFEQDYRKTILNRSYQVAMSPQNLTCNDSFEIPSTVTPDFVPTTAQSPNLTQAFDSWMSRPTSMDFTQRMLPPDPFMTMNTMNMDMLNQGLLESSFGTIKPHVLSCPNPEVMLGLGDPMIYSGFDPETLRL